MAWRRAYGYVVFLFAITWLVVSSLAAASEYHGQVSFGGLPVPGATITAIQGSRQFITVANQQGLYSFPDLTDGKWTIEVEMTGFSTIKQDVLIGPNAPAGKWELKLLPLDQIKAQIRLPPGTHTAVVQAESEQAASPDTNNPEKEAPQEDLSQRAADGLLINGSVVNGAASQFRASDGVRKQAQSHEGAL